MSVSRDKLSRFAPQRTELRRQWGIGDDAFCVLFCGKFMKKKRPLDLVKAARSLISSGRLTEHPSVICRLRRTGERIKTGMPCRV